MDHTHSASWRTPAVVIVAACLIAMTGFGVRSAFGLFLEPMTAANGWDRQTFSLAMAIQNLLWGFCLPVAGALADRYGAQRVIAVGAVIYALGIWGMAQSASSFALQFTGGVVTGAGISFTAFSLATATMAKVVGPEKRSLVLGIGTAAGSMGQVVFSPITHQFMSAFGWQQALLMLAFCAALMFVFAFALPSDPSAKGETHINQTMSDALLEARQHSGYLLLTAGFFVCGFQVAFIAVHFPSYVQDIGLPAHVGAWSLSLVGMFNIVGSFTAGVVGQKWSKKWSLSFIYLVRAFVILFLLLAPKTAMNTYLFAAVMGLFWLSTVPLTSAIVAQVFGARYMTMLFGFVFLSHQLGSFLGVWLGGVIFDRTGSYDMLWWISIALAFAAALVHMPINEKPLARLQGAGGQAA